MSFSFDDCRQLDALCQDLILSDFYRGQNRARIQSLANGSAPYSDEEVQENGVVINVNDLTHTRLLHDARSQFYNAFLKTGFFAKATTDAGAVHRRGERSAFVTKAWNKYLKRSLPYYERLRAEFGMLVLHGISPAVWENADKWCPKPIGIEDCLVPSKTLLGFENLPFLVIRRSFTGIELQKLTHAAKRDPGWNMDVVQRCVDYLGEEMTQLRSLNWPEVWAPEKVQERVKEDGGYFLGDQAPALDMFDIYGYVDDGKEAGWVRRIILDSWNTGTVNNKPDVTRKNKRPIDKFNKEDFVFTSGDDIVALDWQQFSSFQFADLSAVFPARYNSVRSLGWITYASCHLGNRLRCKFYEAVFESLMQLYKVKSADDAANALKVNLINRGLIDDSIKPVPAAERWQVNANLIELGLNDNASVTGKQSAAWVPQPTGSDKTEKTRFQYMAELQQMTQLVSASLNQAYMYQNPELREIFRRFCKPRSSDPDVRAFQSECIKFGIPEKYLHDPSAWDIEAERVMGAGNKTLEMTIAGQLMEWREKYDPEAQRDILRDATLALTDDAGKALRMVPHSPVTVTSATHDAEHTASDLLAGIKVKLLEGVNHPETIETLLSIMADKIQTAQKQGNMMQPQELQGLGNIAQHIGEHIKVLGMDEKEKQRVKQYQDLLTKLMNLLKGFAQRIQQQMEKAAKQNGNGQQGDPKDAAKVKAMQMQAQVKTQNAKESHAQRTAQRQIQFEQQQRQDQEKHQADIAALDAQAAGTIRRSRLSMEEE
jgi:hypothetical protein